jgi:uncharacterized protein YyaL (SSP411 family)
VDGLISLYEATFDSRWIQASEELAEQMIRMFWDPKDGGFYFTSEDHEFLIHRPKDFYDNATPSGNAVASSSLLRLWKLTGEKQWSQYAISVLESISGLLPRHPAAFPHLLCALDFYLGKTKEIAIIGNPLEKSTRDLLHVVFHEYLPNKVVACGESGGLFLLENKARDRGFATAYVCENFTCRLSVTAPADLCSILKGSTVTGVSKGCR